MIETEPTEIQIEARSDARAEIPAAHREAIQRSIEIAFEAVKNDRPLRVPQSDEDRANGFAKWMTRKREQFGPMMRDAITQGFASVATLDDFTIEKYVDCCLWPEVEYWLQTLALRYYAGFWVRSHMGDATYLSMPERLVNSWRIPLGVNGYGKDLGQIVLDNEGNVLEKLTTTRQEIMEKLRDRTFSPTETITR